MTPDHDLLNRIRFIRQIEVDKDQSARAVERAREVILGRLHARQRSTTSKALLIRIAAPVSSLVAAGLVLAVFYLHSSRTSVAFAKVQDRMLKAHSIQFVQTTMTKGVPHERTHVIVLSDGLARIGQADGSYSVLDFKRRKAMAVSANGTRVMIWHEMPKHVPANMNLYDFIKHAHEESPKELPTRMVDGIEAAGFAITIRNEVLGKVTEVPTEIWVDPETKLPIRMEAQFSEDSVTVVHNIRFDEVVDQALVSFDPPVNAVIEEYGPAQSPPPDVRDAVDRIRSGHSAEPNNAEIVRLSEVLNLWNADDKDAAVMQLRMVSWDDPSVLSDIPIMSLSEQEFTGLPYKDRALIQEQALELTSTARQLAAHALHLGEQRQESGDPAAAKECVEAVRKFGVALSKPSRLKILQMVGQALTTTAERQLSELD